MKVSDMENLLRETKVAIWESGHNTKDIVFIGSEKSGHECEWRQFEKLADRFYDNGFGSAQVADDLIIVFSDGQKMWRGEYDGSEWWEYSTPFKDPQKPQKIESLFVRDGEVGWCGLSEINGKTNNSQ